MNSLKLTGVRSCASILCGGLLLAVAVSTSLACCACFHENERAPAMLKLRS